jgi:hypothetical protein
MGVADSWSTGKAVPSTVAIAESLAPALNWKAESP